MIVIDVVLCLLTAVVFLFIITKLDKSAIIMLIVSGVALLITVGSFIAIVLKFIGVL